uniref:SET domain-containing protein n=1 Tax=Panagrellus redivivus TaxID=6233 RepID=A0A7E4VXC4_PANRE
MVEGRESSRNDERSLSSSTTNTTTTTIQQPHHSSHHQPLLQRSNITHHATTSTASAAMAAAAAAAAAAARSSSLHHRIGAAEDEDDDDMDVDVGGVDDMTWHVKHPMPMGNSSVVGNAPEITVSKPSSLGIPSLGSSSASSPASRRMPTPPALPAAPGNASFSWIDFADRDLAALAVFHVPDKPTQGDNRAVTSLPLNLTIRASPDDGKHGVWSVDLIPRGARFGPLCGESHVPGPHHATVMPAEASAAGGPSRGGGAWSAEQLRAVANGGKLDVPKPWKVLSESGGRVLRVIETDNPSRANWLRSVRMARTREEQNLVACQVDNDICFYSIKNIVPNTELLFWYSKEYAQRLQMPASCEFWKNVMTTLNARPRNPEPSMPKVTHHGTAATGNNDIPSLPDQAIDYSLKNHNLQIATSSGPKSSDGEADEDELIIDDTTDDDERKSKAATVSPKASSSSASSTCGKVDPDDASHVAYQRPNVIQQPVLRSFAPSAASAFTHPHPAPPTAMPQVPQGPTAASASADAFPMLRINQLSNIIDYYRRANAMLTEGLNLGPPPPPSAPPAQPSGGLWMPPTMPQLGVAPGSGRLPTAGLYGGRAPIDDSPLSAFAATAGASASGFPPGYTNFYAAAAAAAAKPQASTPIPTHPGHVQYNPYNRHHMGSTLNLATIAAAVTAPNVATSAPLPTSTMSMTMAQGSIDTKYLQSHENGRTRYACKECAKTFGQLSNLKVHLRTHTGERPYKCTRCNKGFTQLAHLQKHDLVHTGEKPHKCSVCEKRFSSTSNLKTHLRLHNGHRPYSCDMCTQRFTQLVHLKLHKRLHTNERPFDCKQCGRTYISPSGLRTHWKNTACRAEESQLQRLEAAIASMPMPYFDESGNGQEGGAYGLIKLEPMAEGLITTSMAL